jgi:hypothetical protein
MDVRESEGVITIVKWMDSLGGDSEIWMVYHLGRLTHNRGPEYSESRE